MSHAMIIHETGGPEVMKWEPFDPGQPAPGEALVRHEAVGLNYIDVYHRSGLYPLPALPAVPGLEGAGIVEAVGAEVTEASVGDRVAYAGVPPGAYAEKRLIPAHRLIRLPETISTRQAAAMMLQGMTARYLLKKCFPVKKGDTILIHAAAGGVGLLVCQWARHLGARVIGTVGSEAKAELARANGCDHPILYDREDFSQRVRDLTGGAGVAVVYDSVGLATFMKSIDCLQPMGTLVSFGQSSGKTPPVDIGLLGTKGSLFLTRPSLMTYTARREDLVEHARDLFDVVATEAVRIEIGRTWPLAEAAEAHRALESRQTTGTSLLIP